LLPAILSIEKYQVSRRGKGNLISQNMQGVKNSLLRKAILKKAIRGF
jgi:hypothetical protein